MQACTVQSQSVSAGVASSVCLRIDGRAVVQCDGREATVPELESGINYIDFSVGSDVAIFLRSDGQIVQVGPDVSPDEVPYRPEELQEGIRYTQVSAGFAHMVLLRSDGCAVACGENFDGQCDIPEAAEGLHYTQVAAGTQHTVLLQSDGRAVAFGGIVDKVTYGDDGSCNLPEPDEGTFYIQASASDKTALLRSDGCAVVPRDVMSDALGRTLPGNEYYCVLKPNAGITYSQVSAGGTHVVLLQSDGRVVSVGGGNALRLTELEAAGIYTEVSAGQTHTILVRSDGRVVAFGYDVPDGFSSINGVQVGFQTVSVPLMVLNLIVDRSKSTAADRRTLACHAVSGRLLGHADVSLNIRPHRLLHQVARACGVSEHILSLRLFLHGRPLHASKTLAEILI